MNITKIIYVIIIFCLLPAAVKAAPMQVFVSIAPEKWLVDQLGGEQVSTSVLLDKGQDPHSFQPAPSQITALFRARIYFTVGMEFEQQISRKINHSAVQVIDCTGLIQRIPITGHLADQQVREQPAPGRHDHALDPHVWLTPLNLLSMATVMAEALMDADPDNVALYRDNLDQVRRRLEQLDLTLQEMLAPVRGSTFFVFHPAFGYFARAYQLHQQPVEIEGKSPTPRQLYALIKKAKVERVRVIFVQPQFDRKSAATVAQAIGGKVVPLDPLSGKVIDNLKTMAAEINAALE